MSPALPLFWSNLPLPALQIAAWEQGTGFVLTFAPDATTGTTSLTGVPLQFSLQSAAPGTPSGNITPALLLTGTAFTLSGSAPQTILLPLTRAQTLPLLVGNYFAEVSRLDLGQPLARLSISVTATARPSNT